MKIVVIKELCITFLQQSKLKIATVVENTGGFPTYLWLVEKEKCLTTENKNNSIIKWTVLVTD